MGSKYSIRRTFNEDFTFIGWQYKKKSYKTLDIFFCFLFNVYLCIVNERTLTKTIK